MVTSVVSTIPNSMREITNAKKVTYKFLEGLNSCQNLFGAIEYILDKTPDGKMAINAYQRLSNQGIKIEWHDAGTNKKTSKYDRESDEFCARLGLNNSAGLDGLTDQLFWSMYARGGMAIEIVVNSDATDIVDFLIIDPATFTKFVYNEKKRRYDIFQKKQKTENGISDEEVNLYDGNFIYVPFNPKAGRPDGSLLFESAVMTMSHYYNMKASAIEILHRIGAPRYKVTIDREAFVSSMNQDTNNMITPTEIRDALESYMKTVEACLNNLKMDSDFISTDDTKIETLWGGMMGSGIDIRAWETISDANIVNSFLLTPTLLGRRESGSYGIGQIDYKVMIENVNSSRKGYKRILEKALSYWPRVKGYNIYPKVILTPIDWEKEKDIIETELKKIEKVRRAEEYKWIDHDTAASMGMNADKAAEPFDDKYAYVNKNFGNGE